MAASVEARPTTLPIPQGFLHTLHQIDQRIEAIQTAQASSTATDPETANGYTLLVEDLQNRRTALEKEFELPGMQNPELGLKPPVESNKPMYTIDVMEEYHARKKAEGEAQLATWAKEGVPADDERIKEKNETLSQREKGRQEAPKRIDEEFFPERVVVPIPFLREANSEIPLPNTLLRPLEEAETQIEELQGQLAKVGDHNVASYILSMRINRWKEVRETYLRLLKEF